MTMQTAEITTTETLRTLLRRISALPNNSLVKLADYVEELIEEQEEAEDIAYIEAHKDEGPNIPLSEVIAKYEALYGPLD